MNVIMKATDNINLSLLGTVLLASCLFTLAGAAPLTVTNTFVDGNVLSAGELNTNFGDVKTAVDDNNTKIGDNTESIGANATAIGVNSTAIGDNTTAIGDNGADITINRTDIDELQAANSYVSKVFNASIRYQIPVLSNTAGITTVRVWVNNRTKTTCTMTTTTTNAVDSWHVGANTKSTFFIFPTYFDTSLAGVVGGFPLTTTTTTIVEIFNMNVDVSSKDFVYLSLSRNETASSDTCNAGDVSVRGAMVTYPGGTQYFVPVQDMVVE